MSKGPSFHHSNRTDLLFVRKFINKKVEAAGDAVAAGVQGVPNGLEASIFVVAVNQVGDNGRGLNFPGVALAFGPDGRVLARVTSPSEKMLVVKLQQTCLRKLRSHSLAYFLPHRRQDLYRRD